MRRETLRSVMEASVDGRVSGVWLQTGQPSLDRYLPHLPESFQELISVSCRLRRNRAQHANRLLDDLVCPQQHGLRDRQPKRPCRLAIDSQFELGRLLDGEVPGPGALENLIHVSGRPPEQIAKVRPVGHEAA